MNPLRTILVAALATVALGALPSVSAQADPAPTASTPTGSYLALVSQGRRTPQGLDTSRQRLELVAPTGARTVLFSSAVSKRGRGYVSLVDASADGRTALLLTSIGARFSRTRALGVDTATGAVRAVDVGRSYRVEGLAPDGGGLLLGDYRGRQTRLATLSWAGALRTSDVALGGRVLDLDATTFLVPTGAHRSQSLDAVDATTTTTTTTITRRYPTPGETCSPVRRWDASQVLLSCYSRTGRSALRLLDPTSGAVATLSTGRDRRGSSGTAFDARALGGSLYLQTIGRCGLGAVERQLPDGSTAAVRLPGRRTQVTLLGTRESGLVLQTGGACRGRTPRQSITVLDPATGAVQPLVVLPGRESFDLVLPLGEKLASMS